MKKIDNIVIGNARILFRNFAGQEGNYNPAGNRNFSVCIDDPEFANHLEDEGWNVKYLQPREEGDAPQAFLHVKVGFGKYPPKIVLISNNKKTFLDEDTVEMLDWVEIENVDIIIRPYSYTVRGTSGISAYVKDMYVTMVDDEFSEKYSHLN